MRVRKSKIKEKNRQSIPQNYILKSLSQQLSKEANQAKAEQMKGRIGHEAKGQTVQDVKCDRRSLYCFHFRVTGCEVHFHWSLLIIQLSSLQQINCPSHPTLQIFSNPFLEDLNLGTIFLCANLSSSPFPDSKASLQSCLLLGRRGDMRDQIIP